MTTLAGWCSGVLLPELDTVRETASGAFSECTLAFRKTPSRPLPGQGWVSGKQAGTCSSAGHKPPEAPAPLRPCLSRVRLLFPPALPLPVRRDWALRPRLCPEPVGPGLACDLNHSL